MFAFGTVVFGWVPASQAQAANPQRQPEKPGAGLYRLACVSCHGPDGKGALRSAVGFDTPLPDFSDCRFATREPDRDWTSVIHLGGRARALDHKMPAFGDALSEEEIRRLVDYIRGFCRDRAWPRGELNLPRPVVTEKAFPEDEALVTTTAPADADRFETRFVYGHRIGPRSQYEVVVPFVLQQAPLRWNRGLGDIAVAFKYVVFDSPGHGSILSAGSEMTFPTGKEEEYLGNRLTLFEPSGTFSQVLPHSGFLHVQAGFGFPLNIGTANNEAHWGAAVGKTFTPRRWGRAWSPMVELLGHREFEFGERAGWELLPEIHVTLSRRQHIAVNLGVRMPLNARGRPTTVMMSVLWDWYRGGLFSGW